MSIYDEMRELSSQVLNEFGQESIALIKIRPGNGPKFNPGPASETRIELKQAVARGVRTKYVSGGMAVATDLQVTMAAAEATPGQSDFFEIDGARLKVVHIEAKPPSGPTVAYLVILRR